jgi:hypothetical protein
MKFLIRRGKKGRALYQPEQSPGKANQPLLPYSLQHGFDIMM